MEQTEFLEKNVFTDLKNMNDGFDEEAIHYFSESDFETVLKQVEYFGIGVYGIKTYLNGKSHADSTHEDHNKKATDPKWYKKAFKTFKMGQSGLLYAATYKVSKKLLER
ncbi:hypothetical protein [Psychroserpens sp.]